MKEKKVPKRQCVGCREAKEKKDMIRVVKTPEGEVVLDRTGRMNGRGAYICEDAECLKKAAKSAGLERSLKMKIDSSIYEELERQMADNE